MQNSTTATPALSLRERRHAETRRTIIEAAVDLAITNGASATTVEEIAQRAGVSPRTFFNHFPTKRDAFLGWSPALDDAAVASFRSADGPLLDDLEDLLISLVDPVDRRNLDRARELLSTNPDLRLHLHQGFRAVEQQIGTVLAGRLALDSNDPTVRVLAATAAALVRVSVDAWRGAEPDTPLAHVVRAHVTVLRDLRT